MVFSYFNETIQNVEISILVDPFIYYFVYYDNWFFEP